MTKFSMDKDGNLRRLPELEIEDKKPLCMYCNDEIEKGFVGFDEGMCELCYEWKREEEELE